MRDKRAAESNMRNSVNARDLFSSFIDKKRCNSIAQLQVDTQVRRSALQDVLHTNMSENRFMVPQILSHSVAIGNTEVKLRPNSTQDNLVCI